MRKFTLMFSLLAAFAICALAADVTGTWSGDMKTPDGAGFHISFTLKQDGANLAGTVQGAQGDPLPISEGKIDGDKISFKVVFNGTTFTHTGTLVGNQIKLDQVRKVTAHRLPSFRLPQGSRRVVGGGDPPLGVQKQDRAEVRHGKRRRRLTRECEGGAGEDRLIHG